MPLPDAIRAELRHEAAKGAESENALAAALMQNEQPGDALVALSSMLRERRERLAAEHKLEEVLDQLNEVVLRRDVVRDANAVEEAVARAICNTNFGRDIWEAERDSQGWWRDLARAAIRAYLAATNPTAEEKK